jgi:hypothetical protein
VSQPHSVQVRSFDQLRMNPLTRRTIPSALITVATPSSPTRHISQCRSDCQLPGPFTSAACERAFSTRPASLARAQALLFRFIAVAMSLFVSHTIHQDVRFVKCLFVMKATISCIAVPSCCSLCRRLHLAGCRELEYSPLYSDREVMKNANGRLSPSSPRCSGGLAG